MVALPWFVLETTGSAGRTGLIGMMAALPALASGILGGVLVDRLGGRRMSVISDIISGAAVLLIPLLYQTSGLNFAGLMLLVFAGAALDIPGVTARRLLLPELAHNAGVRDEAITSAYETMQGASWIVGPALAGLLIHWIGTVNLLWLTAAGFGISAICIGLFSPAGKHLPEAGGPHAATGAVAEIKAGFRYLRTDSLLLSLAVGLTLMNFLFGPYWSVVLPVQIDDRFGVASRFGLMLTMLGIGNLLGGLLYGAIGHQFRARRREIYLIGVASFPIMLWVFVTRIPYPAMIVSALLAGLFSGPVNPLLVNVRMERIPKELRGRVFATFSGLAGAATPLGMVIAGWLLEVSGVRPGLAILASVATLFTIGLWLTKPLREMNVVSTETVAATTMPGRTPLGRRDPRMDSESN
ncbi:MAG: MFS transporter [Chloroflexota bacterium]|nr:MFS transporter [Chloroflexota bacterium]